MDATTPDRPTQTWDDFTALPEGTLAQLIDGEIIMSPAPASFHQRIISRLDRWMGQYVEDEGLGEVIVSPLDVYLTPEQAFQPDLVFIAADRLDIVSERGVDGVPDLVVEVLSPSTGYYDLTKKRRVYEASDVREYWLADPQERTVEVLTLAEGAYRRAAFGRGAGRVGSVLLSGFGIETAALFVRPGRRAG